MDKADNEFNTYLKTLMQSPTLKDLKQKYRELIKLYHPDKHPERIEWSTKIMQKLNQAYENHLTHLYGVFEGKKKEADFDHGHRIHPQTIGQAIARGDDALRDAVIIGWLKRTPKDSFAGIIRTRVAMAHRFLKAWGDTNTMSRKSLFYSDLFSAFLAATEHKNPRPLPAVMNPTKLFHYISEANKYLDSGIRNFYRFAENRSVSILSNIPLSFFDDAIRLYTRIKSEIDDVLTVSIISEKIKLAGLFEIRIKDPELTYLWPDKS
ncbi:MAG: J domain-containing protein [Spirochaetales bacterium]|nr:J domain-containing protein [Spirochaetales bacterium]